MTTSELWAAVRAQAVAYTSTPAVTRFARDLPRNATQRSQGLPGLLQEAAAGASALCSQPMRLATNLPLVLSVMPGHDMSSVQAAHPDWIAAAGRVEGAHRLTVAWLRARLPGYPNLPAPQLAAGAPLTTHEFTHRLAWTPNERAQRLQFGNPPAEIGRALGADERQLRAVDDTTRHVAAAISRTEEWTRLGHASRALDSESRTSLRLARSRVRDRLSPANVDSYEPLLSVRRDEYRGAVVDEEVADLSGAAADYAVAFAAADLLIEHAASDVFGQLVCYPVSTLRPGELELQPHLQPIATFTIEDVGPWPDPGMLVWLDDPLVRDAVEIGGVNFNLSASGRVTLRLTARVLRHTAEAWS